MENPTAHAFRPRQRQRQRQRRRRPLRGAVTALVAVTALALAGGMLVMMPSASAAGSQSVSVDLRSTQGPATGVGSGFLYGLTEDGSGPQDSLLTPLAPRSARGGGARLDGGGWVGDNYRAGSGYQRRIASALGQARRITTSPNSGTYDLLVSDVWGADTTQPDSTVYPCTNGDCSNWQSFLDRLVSDVAASGLKVRYDIWNEPTGAFFKPGFNTPQYYAMWDSAVREIRAHAPSAVIVGPSLWDFSPGNISPFLDHAKAAGTLPNVLNWHFSSSPVADAQTARDLLAAKGISGLSLSMNEYIHADEQHAGYQAWYLAQLAHSGIDAASHAIWTDCCAAGTLDSTLVDSGGSLRPTGQWWVYQAYAQLTGSLAATTSSGSVNAVAAVDAGKHRAGILLGDSGSGSPAVDLTVSGLTSAAVAGSGGVTVTVRRIPDQAPLDAPVTVATTTVPAGTDTAHIPVTWQSGQDAYVVTVTPSDGTSTPPPAQTVAVDGTVTDSGAAAYFAYGANWGVTNGVSDMYQQTANWSYVSGARATFTFTGSKVALHAVRDADQGIMSVAVDGGSRVDVDDYAAARNASGTVWTSPALGSGRHVLTIVNTGRRNGASSGNNIAIDRADVTTP
ncbi:beta-xylosidase [Actinacidiphila alni]|uniref:beta-xylosidase n=1 Tax=Actinacidiphila alni TaxID=380248 RepID=UPI0033E7FBF9